MGRMVDGQSLGDEFLVADERGFEFASTPFWDGARYWIGFLDEPQFPSRNQRLSVVRIDPDGRVLPPGTIEVLPWNLINHPGVPAIGHDGTTAIVTWNQTDQNGFLSSRAARVADDGAVLDPGGVPILERQDGIGIPGVSRLACEHGECLLVYSVNRPDDVSQRATRLQGVTELDRGFDLTTSPAGQTDPAATYGAGRYLVVWRDSRPSPERGLISPIRGWLFSPAADDRAPVTISPSPNPFRCPNQEEPAVVASASTYLVVWREGCLGDDVYAQVLGADGQPLVPSFDPGNRGLRDTHPSVASSGDQFLVLWEYEKPRNSLQARRFTASGVPLGERFTLPSTGLLPVAAFDGTNYLAVWVSNSVRDVFAARVTTDGTVLDPQSIAVAADPLVHEDAAAVACGGSQCLVVWRNGPTQIHAARVVPDGSVLDPGGFLVSRVVRGSVPIPSVAFDGQGFTVVWRGPNGELIGAQVTRDGSVIPPGSFPIAAADATARNPSVVSSGAGHVLALHDRFDSSPAFRVGRVRARVIGPAAGSTGSAPPDGSQGAQ